VDLSPSELAGELHIPPKRLRDFLRERFPRSESEHGEDWVLTEEQAAAVRTHFDGASQAQSTATSPKWQEFATLAAEVLAAGIADLDGEERNYKHAVAANVRAAREACVNGEQDWPDRLQTALGSGSNLIYHLTRLKFKAVVDSDMAGARPRLLNLWEQEGGAASIAAFGAYLEEAKSGISPGGVLEIVSTLLMGVTDAAPFKSRAIARFAARVGESVPDDSHALDARWANFVGLMDRASTALRAAGVEVNNRVDAQSIMWIVSQWPVERIARGELAQRIQSWRGEEMNFERQNRVDKNSEDGGWRILRGGLLHEASILTGDPSVWTAENAREIITRVFDNDLEGPERSFDEKIRIQLDDAKPGVIQLVAEIQLVRQLPTGGIKLRGASKGLALYASLADENWTMPEWLATAFEGHVFGGGNRFNQDQWMHIVLTARVLEAWCELEEPERDRILASPWELLDFLETVGGDEAAEKHMRMVLAYLAWPNYFHPIISSKQIDSIRTGYREFLETPRGDRNADTQRDLYDIQRGLEQRFGGVVNFYESPYDAWRGDQPPPPLPLPPGSEFERLARSIAASLHMDEDALGRIGRVLEARRQIVFYGPPGTGKTYVARELAKKLAGDDAEDAVRLVQFHPSYSYEDFFEGFRPVAADGGTGFSLQSGPLRKLAISAQNNPDQPHFLIIDEMNRGNLAKVFGELYFLLEYREQKVFLQYSPEVPFTLPDNLYVIGTMNTTDRSIGLVDAAIRRRFAFIEFHPEISPVEGVLERYLEANGHSQDMSDLLSRLNARIGDRDLRVGPSYLMRPQVFEVNGLEDVWEYDILPLLFEQFHGRKDVGVVRKEFSLEAIRDGAAPNED